MTADGKVLSDCLWSQKLGQWRLKALPPTTQSLSSATAELAVKEKGQESKSLPRLVDRVSHLVGIRPLQEWPFFG